jgi:hypothetical protein
MVEVLVRKNATIGFLIRIFWSVLITPGSTDGDTKTKRDLDYLGIVIAIHSGSFSAYLLSFRIFVIIVIRNVTNGHAGWRIAPWDSKSCSRRFGSSFGLRPLPWSGGSRINVLKFALVSIRANAPTVKMTNASRRR